MSDVPKIVHDRLRAAVPREAHPDADVLTAFAEQALSGAERESVLGHLARCGDCREAVAMSIPPLEAVSPAEVARDEVSARTTVSNRSSSWFAWPNLRWAGLAAGIVAVASVLLLQPGRHPERTAPTAIRPDESKVQTLQTYADTAAPAPAIPELPRSAPAAAKPDNLFPSDSRVLDRGEPVSGRSYSRSATASTSLVDNRRLDSLETKNAFTTDASRLPTNEGDKLAVKVPAVPAASAKAEIAASQPINGSSQEVVVLNGADAAVQSAPADGKLMARNVEPLPINKAKPAAKEEGGMKSQVEAGAARGQFAPAYVASDSALLLQKQRSKQSKDKNGVAQWSLAQGKLQRSVDAGTTWQIALQLEHPLLSFGARGSDVWAGGQSGTLFHSSDGGTTWSIVQPSTNTGPLAADIVAIEIRGPADVSLSTSTNESWTTSNGGKTWEKK